MLRTKRSLHVELGKNKVNKRSCEDKWLCRSMSDWLLPQCWKNKSSLMTISWLNYEKTHTWDLCQNVSSGLQITQSSLESVIRQCSEKRRGASKHDAELTMSLNVSKTKVSCWLQQVSCRPFPSCMSGNRWFLLELRTPFPLCGRHNMLSFFLDS